MKKTASSSAATKTIDAHREGAEIHRGSAACREKFLELLEEFSVPACVFPVALIEAAEFVEFGFHRAAGFFWLTQKAKTNNKTATLFFDVCVSGFIELRRLSKIAGLKGKETLIKLPVCEIVVGYPTPDKVKCIAAAGVYAVRLLTDFQTAAAM